MLRKQNKPFSLVLFICYDTNHCVAQICNKTNLLADSVFIMNTKWRSLCKLCSFLLQMLLYLNMRYMTETGFFWKQSVQLGELVLCKHTVSKTKSWIFHEINVPPFSNLCLCNSNTPLNTTICSLSLHEMTPWSYSKVMSRSGSGWGASIVHVCISVWLHVV